MVTVGLKRTFCGVAGGHLEALAESPGGLLCLSCSLIIHEPPDHTEDNLDDLDELQNVSILLQLGTAVSYMLTTSKQTPPEV